MSDNKKSWALEVDENGIITFPPEMLEELGWKAGDKLLWRDNKNGTWSLIKKDNPNTETEQ